MPVPTFRQMRTFLAVVESGGVSSAARMLNLTQPAASQQRRELERCLRVRLLDRAGSTRALIDGWFRRAGVTPDPAMQLDSVESMKVLVGGGLGASIVPRMSLTQPIAHTVTRRLRPGLSRDLALVSRREKVIDRGMRVVVEALRGIARD